MADQIVYIDRETGKEIRENTPGGGMLRWMYQKPTGRLALNALFKRKIVSSTGGAFMDSRFSRRYIKPFIRDHHMDMSDYIVPEGGFRTFNDFFYRKIRPEARPIGEEIVSPADGKTVAFARVEENTGFFVKGQDFTLKSFLEDDELAREFTGGPMIIVRLAPVDYHRFHFPASGKASASRVVKGHYFSVSPIALQQSLRIFCQNLRTHCLLETEDYGRIIVSEVGATMVGSIIQTYEADSQVEKGQEKGYFAFGGSTVVLLFEAGKVMPDQDLLDYTARGIEAQVKMGTKIAHRI